MVGIERSRAGPAAAAAAPPPACGRADASAGGGRVRLAAARRALHRLARAVQAALDLVEQRPCLGHRLGPDDEAVIAQDQHVAPARAPAPRPPRGSGAGRACSRAPRPTAARPAARRPAPRRPSRIASAIVRTEWVWTTIRCGSSACSVVSIDGRRPSGLSSATTAPLTGSAASAAIPSAPAPGPPARRGRGSARRRATGPRP